MVKNIDINFFNGINPKIMHRHDIRDALTRIQGNLKENDMAEEAFENIKYVLWKHVLCFRRREKDLLERIKILEKEKRE